MSPTAAGHGEILLSAAAFEGIRALLKCKTGIHLEENSDSMILSRLSSRVRRQRLPDFDAYLAHVRSEAGAQELVQMINALTTNTTRFFREPGHFDLLETDVLPNLIEKAKRGARIRLWSAACASGEEAYGIAALVLQNFPDARDFDIRILGTDIDTHMLQRAKAGIYPKKSISGVPDRFGDIMFEPDGGDGKLHIRQRLKDMTTFRYLNFVDPWPVRGPFQVIFCRNVAIYMAPDTQSRIWQGLENVLDQEGALFIGHSERISPDLALQLELFGPTSFRRPLSFIGQNANQKERGDVTT
ncbi:chemotaxis protein methyltransferase CheR [Sulfitobacter marinus]|uniref:Chemotaxis protein methyltransferase n=1 Tax=Sulfitobacter marinus TaxID=394264 RepID=A0A1I6QYS6_9RHOB|nr:protein-glutamate O-methyltransferase [Sulfitobacter marinus]SFS57555.1 chemotaxis protein methyltransferase CheR [Sulfitobacter marinus]